MFDIGNTQRSTRENWEHNSEVAEGVLKMWFCEKVTIERIKTDCKIAFESGYYHTLKTSACNAEYVGKKLKWFSHHNGQLMSESFDSRQICKEIQHVVETTLEQITTARGQIEDSGGEVGNYSALDISIMDYQMRSMLAEKAMEIDNPWNPSNKFNMARNQIAVDLPEYDLF